MAASPEKSAQPFDWEKFVADVKLETRNSRRVVEKRAQRLALLDRKLRKQVEENMETTRSIQKIDCKIEQALQREKSLARLIAAAKKRKAQFHADVEEAEKKIEEIMAAYNEQTTTAMPILTTASMGVKKNSSSISYERKENISHENRETSGLQQKLHATRSKYRKICDENKRLWSVLTDMRAEDDSFMERLNVHNDSSISSNRFEFSNALQDLMKSFRAVTHAAFVIE